jgi:TrmH family RNA methyltransferase
VACGTQATNYELRKIVTKAEIQLIRSLDDKRSREEAGLFVAEGEKLVCELLASDFRVRKVYHTGYMAPGSPPVEGWREAPGWSVEQIPAKEMERASRLKTPTDCLALVEIPRRTHDPAALRGGLTLALDGVQNPGNLGTIIRLADWFGIRNILCSADSADCWSPKVVQATMGAITRVAVHYGDLAAVISGVGVPVYGTFLEGENIYGSALGPEGIIVLGSEGRGISTEIERLVTRKLFIPPFPPEAPTSESLNVAIAAAIVCSEFRRRQ